MRDLLTYLIVGIGAGIGSIARFIYIQKGASSEYLTKVQQINIIGSFLAGLLFGAILQTPFLTAGILGGFTTFSTMAVEGVNQKKNSVVYFSIMYVAGIVSASLGIYLGVLING